MSIYYVCELCGSEYLLKDTDASFITMYCSDKCEKEDAENVE